MINIVLKHTFLIPKDAFFILEVVVCYKEKYKNRMENFQNFFSMNRELYLICISRKETVNKVPK